MSNVSNLVKTIQDIMRKDAGTYGDAQRLEQLGWMFFLKIFDDREKELELLRDHYKSPLPQHLRWSEWAADEEGITGEALLDFVNNTASAPTQEAHGWDRGQTLYSYPHHLRGCQQLHEEWHPHAPGHQQDQRHRLQCFR